MNRYRSSLILAFLNLILTNQCLAMESQLFWAFLANTTFWFADFIYAFVKWGDK